MWGILRKAYQRLIDDRAKFTALLIGNTIAVFLMIESTSPFARGPESFLRNAETAKRHSGPPLGGLRPIALSSPLA